MSRLQFSTPWVGGWGSISKRYHRDGGLPNTTSVHICKFHSIPNKTFFGSWPQPHEVGVAYMTFYISGHFMQFPVKLFGAWFPYLHPTPWGEGSVNMNDISVWIWTCSVIHSKPNSVGTDSDPTSTPWDGGLRKMISMQM